MRVITSGNDPIDFCRFCAPSEWAAAQEYNDPMEHGPDGRGNCFTYDADHPDYEGTGYKCEVCKWPLTEDDNNPLSVDEVRQRYGGMG